MVENVGLSVRFVQTMASQAPIRVARLFGWYVREYGFADGCRKAAMEVRARLRHIQAEKKRPKQYREHQQALTQHLQQYLQAPLGWRMQRIADAVGDWRNYKGVVLAPVGYDLGLKQRPDHIMHALVEEGYLCLMLEMNDRPREIVCRQPGLYVSNLWEDAVAFFREAAPILYIHYPKFRLFQEFLPGARIVYDVLDDEATFSENGEYLQSDHRFLLSVADTALFSSKYLFEKNRKIANKPLLLENGVYIDDFRSSDADGTPRSDDGVLRVGYHGVLTELLDVDLLGRIADLPGVELVLVGPVAAFDVPALPKVQEAYEELFERSNVRHLGKIPYDQLRSYLAEIDVGIVPFRPGAATDGVSPLKLFEFLAAGKPVVATRTKTLEEYADIIEVGSPEQVVAWVKERSWRRVSASDREPVLKRHDWRHLTRPLLERLAEREVRVPARAGRPPERVDIINVYFFDWKGEVLFRGGAERYVTDLTRICGEMGLKPRILQSSQVPFERSFRGVPVIGIPVGGAWNLGKLSGNLERHTMDADLVIASPMDLACGLSASKRIVGINHGIHWDATTNRFFVEQNTVLRRQIVEALQRCRAVTCVDTNFINWIRTVDWDLGRHLHYVPNYVNHEQFRAVDKDFDARVLKILFPRRMCEPRGLYLTIQAFDRLLAERQDIHLTLCGQAVGEDTRATRSFMARHPGRVDWIERDMDQMGEVYAEHHVVLIPTLCSEGTSLSCLEAFASNCAVIATNIGGLPNLVLDEYNGLLIRPTGDDLQRAVTRLADDRALAADLARRAQAVAQNFSYERWSESWKQILRSVMW